MTYSDITINDRNPVKRWFQRRRFSDALRVLCGLQLDDCERILDFGGGDGELVSRLLEVMPSAHFWLYEPAGSLLAEARQRLAPEGRVTLTGSLGSLQPGSFDLVFCLEVFEHLPDTETRDALAAVHRLLKSEGHAVIGVPVEVFLPALVKGLFRMSRRYGDFDARPKNVIAAAFGRPPTQRPVAEISPGVAYHFHHLGFDFRVFQRRMEDRFAIVRKWFSPIPFFGAALNSEVYLLLRKLDARSV